MVALHRNVAGVHLGHGGQGARLGRAPAAGDDRLGGAVGEAARGLHLGRHVRELELDALERADGAAELDALAAVGQGVVEGALGEADANWRRG